MMTQKYRFAGLRLCVRWLIAEHGEPVFKGSGFEKLQVRLADAFEQIFASAQDEGATMI
jgi:hypothetical protein